MVMGQNNSMLAKVREIALSYDLENSERMDYGENNGLFLNNTYFPPEILSLILSYVDVKTLYQSCALVCNNWNILLKENVWKIKAERKCKRKFSRFPSKICQRISVKNPFDKNLIKNPNGIHKMKHWQIILNGGDRFNIEKPPVNCKLNDEMVQEGINSCFTTSYQSCSKKQIIDLWEFGLTSDFLDNYQPPIYISEWYGSRIDCGCIYELAVELLQRPSSGKCIDAFEFRTSVDQWQGGFWSKVEHTFKNYGPGLRYITFYHHGKDTKFWAGHYGSKMTGATVKVLYPEVE